MMIRALIGIMAVVVTFAGATEDSRAAGNPQKGSQVFRQCLACHSLEPGRHLTGPSLANIWGRKAGTAEDFYRYSKALKSANITWNAETLDAWLKDPSAFIPNNSMGFAGIESAQARQDLIAYLKVATSSEHPSKGDAGQGGGMMGQMMSRPTLNLKDTRPTAQRILALRYYPPQKGPAQTAARRSVMPYFYLTPKQDDFNKIPELQVCIAEALYDAEAVLSNPSAFKPKEIRTLRDQITSNLGRAWEITGRSEDELAGMML